MVWYSPFYVQPPTLIPFCTQKAIHQFCCSPVTLLFKRFSEVYEIQMIHIMELVMKELFKIEVYYYRYRSSLVIHVETNENLH